MNLTALDIMNGDVISFQPDTSVREALKEIANKNFSGAPVVNDDDELIGVVTERTSWQLFPSRPTIRISTTRKFHIFKM